jgi:AcrR family transcriptional regulator
MPAEPPTKGARTHQEIVQAAHSLFLAKGYNGTSMRQIAQQAGITVSSIYNHFSTKEDIFIAVVEAFHPYHELLPILETSSGETKEAFLRNAARSMLDILERRPDFINLILIEVVEFNSRHLPHLFEEIYPRVAGVMQSFFQRRGALRQMPPQVVVRAFMGFFFSYFITNTMIRDYWIAIQDDSALDDFVDIFLYGILADEQPNPLEGRQP